MIEYFSTYISPTSPTRSKLAVWMIAQATSDVSTKQISELVKTLDLSAVVAAEAATDLQARLTAADHNKAQEIDGLKNYLLHDLKVAETKIDAAVTAWKELSNKTNGHVGDQQEDPPSLNGTKITFIEDVRDFKARLTVTPGARPTKDLTEYEDLDSKL